MQIFDTCYACTMYNVQGMIYVSQSQSQSQVNIVLISQNDRRFCLIGIFVLCVLGKHWPRVATMFVRKMSFLPKLTKIVIIGLNTGRHQVFRMSWLANEFDKSVKKQFLAIFSVFLVTTIFPFFRIWEQIFFLNYISSSNVYAVMLCSTLLQLLILMNLLKRWSHFCWFRSSLSFFTFSLYSWYLRGPEFCLL